MRYISCYQNSSHSAIHPVERKRGSMQLTYMRYISCYQNSSHSAIHPVERKRGSMQLTYIMLVAGGVG